MTVHDQSSISDLAADLATCDREAIHIPGSIQPHGALFVIDAQSGEVLQAADADNVLQGKEPVGQPLTAVLPPSLAPMLGNLGRIAPSGPSHLGVARLDDAAYHVLAHRSGQTIIVELERTVENEPASFDEVYPYVHEFFDQLQHTSSIEELADLAAHEVRRLTGLDRVLVYRFDESWNGAVIAEDGNERLPSYLDLRFPASDIPAQARELYRLNRLRLISDARYTPSPLLPPLNPRTGQPADLSFAVLRSVSPVHLEYMRNMETMASMSISLLDDDRLWGLISCHNRDAVRVPYHVRMACDFIGKVLSMQISARESSTQAERRNALRSVQVKLLAHMTAADHYVDGLVVHPEDLLGLTGARGAAVVSGGACALVGETPAESDVRNLTQWLGTQHRAESFVTDCLAKVMPGGEVIKDRASGVLAISISQIHDSYVLWFRPEVIRTVRWGGDPQKRAQPDSAGLRLHPRKSFESWEETVRLRALPWDSSEVEAATELRSAIVDIVLRSAEETAELSERLTRINKELEAFSYSVSHDLRAPFRHIVGYAQLLKKFEGDRLTERGIRYIDTIVESALSAGTLVDDLLSFSHMGRATLTLLTIDVNQLVQEVLRQIPPDMDGHKVEWRIADLPPTRADPTMLRLVFQNLLDNALKFSRGRNPAVIEIGARRANGEIIYHVRDNGTGFDMAYVGKLFGVFQRLHRVEEFEGTGIGLANIKRIMERHGGRVWAEAQLDRGATFYFALPNAGEVWQT